MLRLALFEYLRPPLRELSLSYHKVKMMSCNAFISSRHCRNFLKSKWGMEEFMIADSIFVDRGKNCRYIIIVLKDNLSTNELPREMRPYLSSHSYIDATKNTDLVTKRLRYVLSFSNVL